MTTLRSITAAPSAARQGVVVAAWAYLIGMTIHASDHLYRGLTGDDMHSSWPGWLQVALSVVAVGLPVATLLYVRAGRTGAAALSTVVGLGSAGVFFALHVLPSWGPFTDSFVDPQSGAQVNWYAWVTAAIGIGGSLWLGISGLVLLRRPGR